METLSTIKIKYKDGTYSKQIPISILSKYVKWNKKNTLVDVLGEIDINTKGSVQDQLDTLFTEKIDTEQLRYYVANLIADEVTEWLDTNINPISGDLVIIDPSLNISGAAADAKATGDAIQSSNAEIQELQNSLNNLGVSLTSKIDDAYVEDGFLYMVSDGEIVVGPLGPFSGGGGGGGGGSETSAVLTVTNTSGWLSKTISAGAPCQISFNWTSIEDDLATGNGNLRILVNNVFKTSREIAQGNVTIDVSEYLSDGANTIKVQVSDVYGQMRSINYSVAVVALSISSSFETTTPFTGLIQFNYTPVGAVTKTVHFILDGTALPTQSTTVSGRQVSYSIPAQSHGGHSLKVYFDAEVNGELVKSNELYYEFMSIEEGNNTSIITSSFSSTTVDQYSLVLIPFRVYSPRSDTTAITIQINGIQVSSQTVDRTEQSYSFRADTVGAKTVAIKAGSVIKTLSFTVNEISIDVQAETEDLVLYLNAQGRSNSEETRNVWEYNNISASLTNFGWRIDGWQKDSDNIDVLRLSGDARVTIPYKIFENDFKGTGKTIEIEFATREVADYNAVILSCFADNIGLKVTPQTVEFRGAQTALTTMYKDNQHLRLSITVSKQNEYRLILVYINGIISRAIQYASGQRFSQLNPVNISIGSNDCGIDIYNIRVYDNNLNRQQIVDNWIADTQDGTLMLDRYARNNVYDEYGNITTSTVPTNLPYMMIEAAEWPQYKGDKKTATGSYTDREYPTKSFTFAGCQINVQGTSSSVYYMKNIDMQFKQGFDVNSTHQDNYALRTGSIPFNRFVLKADVASIESANNTKLVMFYNDTCVYKTPEMIANPKVRWGIEGIPIVMFYYDTSTQETKFMGKYNFNLPKRAPTPYGYSGNDQSWEWQRNNSENVKFQDDDFTSMSWDELEQKEYPTWYDDFEARFPEDTFRDYSALKEFISWVKSTDRTKATGNNLPSNVTYRLNTTSTLTAYGDDNSYTVVDEMQDGVATGVKIITFTKDTPAYRLTKFRAEFADYAEIDSAVFYYLFTEFFLMIDSRAKNMFVGFHGSQISDGSRAMTRKAVFEPYDMDTALGTNNSGVLMFSYSLEDTDTVGGVIVNGSDADVFNAQQSVLWLNVRDAYRPEITSMYRNLRTGAWSYDIVENLFEQHQSKWPEVIYNEDQYIKHLTPLLEPVTYDETTKQYIRTDRYLTMTQGSKTEQRKWWLRGRFRYFDSKYSTGDASANRITLRLFSGGTLTITPALDMYVGVYFGGGTTVSLKRAQANTPVNFVYSQSAQEMETWIDSGDLIRDVGDLSVFYPNEVDFSRAIRLKRLQIGSSESGYSNTHLTTLDVRNCGLLEYIDCSNCPNLAITVNLQGSPRLQEAYFDNTSITGVDLVDGGKLEVLHLPNTITALTLLNLNKLSEFDCDGFENVTRLMLANIDPEVIDPIAILEEIPAHSQVNIQGLAIEAQDATEISELFDLFDTMRGVSREKGANGQWIYTDYDKAQISGTIHTSSLTGAEIADFNSRDYPYITVSADHTSAQLKFYNGSTYITSVTVLDGGDGSYTGTTPTKAQDAQYTYSFAGWSKANDNTVDSDALTAVVADRDVYACYTNTLRKYTITWKNSNGTTLETDNNVPYGTTPTYNGSTPVDPSGNGSPFVTWTPAVASVTGNTTYTATYKPVYTVTFKSQDGATTLQTKKVIQGNTATYTGTTPTNADQTAFLGWSNSMNSSNADATLTNIQSNKTVYAAFESLVEVVEITDSWDNIISNIDNGTYKTKYKLGNYKPLDLGSTYGTVNMQIVAMDTDSLADGTGTAPLTFISKELLATTRAINTHSNTGGWQNCEMRSFLKNTIKPLVTTNVRNRIVNVNKVQSNFTNGSMVKDGQTTVEDIWIPSYKEITNGNSCEATGIFYSMIFPKISARVKTRNGTAANWWTRSVLSNAYFKYISSSGQDGGDNYYNAMGICIGFCLGLEPETISDSWETILANPNYATDYSIGDTKYLNLGTEGKQLMEIVAFDTDDQADGNGKAGITWISKSTLKTKVKYGNNGTVWNNSTIRTYLQNNIKQLIPNSVKNSIVPVIKITSGLSSGTVVKNGLTTTEDIWIPSQYEINGNTSYEDSGARYQYSNILNHMSLAADYVLLRTRATNTNICTIIPSAKSIATANGVYERYVAIGFCTNPYQGSISDSWQTILSNPNYATDYSIGDTKMLNINGEDHLMQIVAFDADDKTSGGKAKISWLMKDLLTTTHSMNSTNTNTGGWPATEMRTWLRNTILPTIDSNIRNHIVDVNKTYYDYASSGTDRERTKTQIDTIWLPSMLEMIAFYEKTGISYTTFFTDNNSRIKKKNGSNHGYWTRSAIVDSESFGYIQNDGNYKYADANTNNYQSGVCIGFCTD